MRLKLLLHFEEPFLIPYNYPHPLYSFLIHAIKLWDPMIAKRVHNNKKDIKFVASKLFPVGSAEKTDKGLLVKSGKVELFVGSPAWPVLEALTNGLAIAIGQLHILGRQLIDVRVRPVETPKRLSGRKLKTLSPVSVYHNNPPNGFKQWDLSPVGQPNSPSRTSQPYGRNWSLETSARSISWFMERFLMEILRLRFFRKV